MSKITTKIKNAKNSFIGYFKRNAIKLIVVILSIIFLIAYIAPEMLIFVKPGEAGVLWRRFGGGTVVDRYYSEGTHVILPWDDMHIYNMRTQEQKDSVSVLSINGLTITAEISIRYHPNYDIVGLLHKNVGPEYATVVVVPEIEAVVRTIIGQYTPEEIYQSQKSIAEQIVKESYIQVEERYISLDDVLIKRITLPAKIKEAIENKLEQQQKAQEYDYILQREVKEAERKRIEAEGIARYHTTIQPTLNQDILTWQGIVATKALAESENAKVVIIGAGDQGLPIILGNQ
ncbi:MAG: prohibitin family protein [Candidatus Electryoneaceae bacterium]|nr:prohibitin family protein [Candidatus Electryoneaceae bacterium]